MIDLAQAKAHLRVDFDTEDALIAAYLAAAIGAVEAESSRILGSAELVHRIDRLVDRAGRSTIALPRGPVAAVAGVDYVDGDGAVQTLTLAGGDFRVVEGEPYLLMPPPGGSWPGHADEAGAVRIAYTAGYVAAGLEVPGALDAAVLLMVGHLYSNREAVGDDALAELPLGVKALCFPFRRALIG
jgi:uncharacterized phiE125 gp8 family phage protein